MSGQNCLYTYYESFPPNHPKLEGLKIKEMEGFSFSFQFHSLLIIFKTNKRNDYIFIFSPNPFPPFHFPQSKQQQQQQLPSEIPLSGVWGGKAVRRPYPYQQIGRLFPRVPQLREK